MQESDTNIIVPLYEDNHLLAINKPAGWLSQGDKTGDEPIINLAKLYVKIKYNKPGDVFLGLCHRLDRPVSGVLLLARTSKALERVNKMFASGQVGKTYLAISHKSPREKSGTITQWLSKDSDRNIVSASSTELNGSRRAVTNYRVLDKSESHNMVELQPLSGRSHQLRVAMKSMKSPILGDIKYGGARSDPKSIALHCWKLELRHPVTKELITITAPVPDDVPWVYF